MRNVLIQGSELLYSILVKLYPKKYSHEFGEEMKYVFSEQLSDTYYHKGEYGIVRLWFRTSFDAFKSLVTQHLESKNQGVFMKYKNILYIALGTLGILSIPLIAMQFSSEVKWDETDFIVIGALVFGAGLLIDFARNKIKATNKQIAVVAVVILAVLWLWAELAVGIFTNWGS